MTDHKNSPSLSYAQTSREKIAVLRKQLAETLIRNGAHTSVPCPVADEVFDQLYGRLWLQGTIIRKHRSAEELLNLIKLDYEATLEFYKQRRESSNRDTINPEDDEELIRLLAEEVIAVEEINELNAALQDLEENERKEMSSWLRKYGIAQLVQQTRMGRLHGLANILKLRNDLLNCNEDLLATTSDLVSWAEQVPNE